MTPKYNAKQLRALQVEGDLVDQKTAIKRQPIYIILDDVLDTYNIGSIFRLADAVAATEIILCAGSETPPNHRIKKASINTTEWVNWRYFDTAAEAIKNLKLEIKNLQVVAIEQTADSQPFDKYEYQYPIAFVVGHETTGLQPETLALVDDVIELPMFGINLSLNVMVSLAIVLYHSLSTSLSRTRFARLAKPSAKRAGASARRA